MFYNFTYYIFFLAYYCPDRSFLKEQQLTWEKSVSFSGGVGQRIALLLKPSPFVSEGCVYMLNLP